MQSFKNTKRKKMTITKQTELLYITLRHNFPIPIFNKTNGVSFGNKLGFSPKHSRNMFSFSGPRSSDSLDSLRRSKSSLWVTGMLDVLGCWM